MGRQSLTPQPTRLAREIAASVDLPPILLPHLSFLFADLTALGATPRRIATLLSSRAIGPRSSVLDLACGKGAVSIELARRLGCRCVGIDAFAPFIDEACAHARQHSVDHRCTFRTGNLRMYRPPRLFDAALMIGLFPVPRAAAVLRRNVRPGGLYVFDDAVTLTASNTADMTRADARAAIESLGDTVLHEALLPRSAVMRLNNSLYRRLAARARALGKQHPRLKPALRVFLARQRRANRLLTGPLRPVIWIVQRGPQDRETVRVPRRRLSVSRT